MWIIAGITAVLLTFFDLDRTFYIPSKTQQRFQLYAWLLGFPLSNGVLAVGVYFAFVNEPALKGFSPWLRAFFLGIGYLAVVRLKVITLKVENKEVPLGPELFYESARSFVYKRINRITKQARYEETTALASTATLTQLSTRAKLSIDQDALLSPLEKTDAKQWVTKLMDDAKTSEEEKRLVLADYILSERRNS